MSKGNKMTNTAASRIQAAAAKTNGRALTKSSFSARAQSAAAKNNSFTPSTVKGSK
jgi:hypothetical protein